MRAARVRFFQISVLFGAASLLTVTLLLRTLARCQHVRELLWPALLAVLFSAVAAACAIRALASRRRG